MVLTSVGQDLVDGHICVGRYGARDAREAPSSTSRRRCCCHRGRGAIDCARSRLVCSQAAQSLRLPRALGSGTCPKQPPHASASSFAYPCCSRRRAKMNEPSTRIDCDRTYAIDQCHRQSQEQAKLNPCRNAPERPNLNNRNRSSNNNSRRTSIRESPPFSTMYGDPIHAS